MQALVLASTSVYRKSLLQRLGLPFSVLAPDLDESPVAGEQAEQLARRLALGKAQRVLESYPDAVIIGSDQVASVQGQLLGKPGNRPRAVQQLQAMRGQTVTFYTSVAIVNGKSAGCGTANNGSADNRAIGLFTAIDKTNAVARQLSDTEIDRYIDLEPAFDCAGSFKVESLGISLFEQIESDDPTALMGLPLIAVCKGLRQMGWQLP